ncbi:MAG: hypothetical protein LBS50_00155 [Prevotellaceae bacterium]|jgi:ligand-binding sensor domain-containing protein/DNA-binding CsgD family transcriptional regulator|nr:hypothetical protein [Prevotellaceae bacterium]
MKKLNFILLALIINVYSVQASWQLPVSNYSWETYNAGTQNWAVRQSQRGWIYTANNYGLLEFDGNMWRHYGIWNSTVLRSVEIGSDGTIYVGGSNEFGQFKSNALGSLTYSPLSTKLPEEYKNNFGEVWNIHSLDNDLYFQTNYFLFKFTSDGEIAVIKSKSKIITSAKIRGGIYVAASDGIYLLAGSHLNALKNSDVLNSKEIKQIAQFGEHNILIGTERNGLYIFDGDKITPFTTEGDNFICTNQLYSLAVSKNSIAVGTVLNGLIIIDIKTRKCTYTNTENGLQNNTILSLCFDDCNNLWLGLDNGIDYVVTESPIMELYGKLNSCGSGYCSLIYDSRLYMATNQGLFYTSYLMQSSERRTTATLISGSQGQVWNIDTLGNTLICSHNRGLFAVVGDRLEPISEEDGFWQVREMKNKNFAVAGAYTGLYLMEKQGKNWIVKHRIQTYKDAARIFEIDRKNRVVILSSKGVERLTFDKNLENTTSEIICHAHNSNDYFSLNKIDNSLIVSNQHICLKSNESEEFVEDTAFFNSLDGVRQYSIIKKDIDNNVWYISNSRLKVLAWDKMKKSYTSKPVTIWNIRGYFIGGFASLTPIGNNCAIAGCVSGFSLGNLNNVRSAPENRELFIRALYTTNVRDSVIYGENFPKIPQKIKIPHKHNSLRIIFGGAISENGYQEYRYYLSPVDDDFGSWGASNSKEYTSLREQKYRFVVEMRSNNSDVVQRTELVFEIQPPFYRAWWAYIIYALLIYALIYWILRYIKIKIHRNKVREERKKEVAIKEQEQQFLLEKHEKEKEMLELKAENIRFKLKNKSQELANILLNHINKKELLQELKVDLKNIQSDLQKKNIEQGVRKIVVLQGKISRNIEQDIDWNRFEENFDIVNDDFIKRLAEQFSWLNKNERKLCIYIKMGLLTKEIAPLMNLSIRGVEMMRYRMRKKMDLGRTEDLEVFFQTFNNDLMSDNKNYKKLENLESIDNEYFDENW